MKGLIFFVALALFLCSFSANAAYFTMPVTGQLYAKPLPTSAGAVSSFGLGTSPSSFQSFFTGLPSTPSPNVEVLLGTYSAGTSIDFGIKTVWGSSTYYAFSNDTTSSSARTAFMDLDNSLHLGGSTVQTLSSNTYELYLDDAASYLVDDNDRDILMQLRVAPTAVPEPSCLAMAALSSIVLAKRRRA